MIRSLKSSRSPATKVIGLIFRNENVQRRNGWDINNKSASHAHEGFSSLTHQKKKKKGF